MDGMVYNGNNWIISMNKDTAILEVMLELCEEENTELRDENAYLAALVRYLEWQNKDFKQKNKQLLKEYNYLLNPDNRKN